jgi:ketosteroid isomerase-like protein
MEVHDVIDLGDADVFPVLTIKGQPLGQTERETALFEWCQITTVREGKVVRIRSFLDRERGREAAGLSE